MSNRGWRAQVSETLADQLRFLAASPAPAVGTGFGDTMPGCVTLQKQYESGLSHYRAGRLGDAEKIYREILQLQPNHAGALHMLGVLAGQRGEADAAIELIRRAIGIDPKYTDAHRNLGVLLMRCGRMEEARTAFWRAAELRPDDVKARLELANVERDVGIMLTHKGRLDEAIAAFSSAIQLNPDFAMAHVGRGHALRAAGQLNEAVSAYRRAVEIKADLVEAYVSMAEVLGCLQRFDEAMESHARAAALEPNSAIVHEVLGGIVLQQHGAVAAIVHYRRALEADPSFLSAWNSLGVALQSHGEFDEAAKCFERILELLPDSVFARAQLVAINRQKAGHGQIEPLTKLLNRADISPEQRIAAEFALATALDGVGRFDEAFGHFEMANRLGKQERALAGDRFDAGEFRAMVEQLIEIFTPEFFEKRRGWGESSELPVFVVGMPRSGTTLVQQIAASHPQVHGAGELQAIAQIATDLGEGDLHAAVAGWSRELLKNAAMGHLDRLRGLNSNALRVVDKTPLNIQFLGLIALLFPAARVIVCRRDARDTCLSCYFQSFARGNAAFSYGLADCGHYHRGVEKLMDHWLRSGPVAMMEMQYEALVADLEGQSRRLIDFLGLQWDPACLEFHRAQTTVLTASVWQVRQPIYSKSVGRWRHYERHLGPLLESLNLIARGRAE